MSFSRRFYLMTGILIASVMVPSFAAADISTLVTPAVSPSAVPAGPWMETLSGINSDMLSGQFLSSNIDPSAPSPYEIALGKLADQTNVNLLVNLVVNQSGHARLSSLSKLPTRIQTKAAQCIQWQIAEFDKAVEQLSESDRQRVVSSVESLEINVEIDGLESVIKVDADNGANNAGFSTSASKHLQISLFPKITVHGLLTDPTCSDTLADDIFTNLPAQK